MERGQLSNKDERWLARVIDKAKKFKNPLVEAIDYYVFRLLIKLIDDILIDKIIPDDWDNPIQQLINMGKARNVEGIKELVATKANEKIDIPFVEEPAETQLFRSALGLLTAKMYMALDWLEKMGDSVEDDDNDQ